MTASSSIALRLFVVAITSFVIVEACSSSAGRRDPNGTGGSGGLDSGAEAGANVIAPDVPTIPEGGASGEVNPLCGAGDCLPDVEDDCADFVPAAGPDLPAPAGGAGGDGGASGAAGVAGEGGLGTSGAAGSTQYACRVGLASGEPVRECAPAGLGGNDTPCFASSDCAAGFGCIDEGAVGRCRPFCCSGEESCERHVGTHCAERPLLETTSLNGQPVPVCAPADACDLSKAPCEPGAPPGADCECTGGTACLVVRANGITTCATPGPGQEGNACPCDYGFLCSAASGMCRMLCALDDDSACPARRCQSLAELPAGWGVCIDP